VETFSFIMTEQQNNMWDFLESLNLKQYDTENAKVAIGITNDKYVIAYSHNSHSWEDDGSNNKSFNWTKLGNPTILPTYRAFHSTDKEKIKEMLPVIFKPFE
jgi:hypothetical protein